jgi:hypothetical protein
MKVHAILFSLMLFLAPISAYATSEMTAAPDVPIYNEGEQVPLMPDETPTEPSCGYPQFIGQNIKDIDQSAIRAPLRVLYPDSPATMDYNPARINIILERDTDVVTEVRCG